MRIYQRVLAGGGPTGAFRPYLYTTIRNLASTWGAQSKDVQVDLIEDFEDDRIPDDPAAWALDRTLTARAFRTLPDRWQTVLWYTEVEGMDPHEVAPLMGMTANGVAALSYRAREGLRKAWLQAHISDATASGDCQWTMSKMGEHARDGLSQRDAMRMTDHLEGCAKCSIVADEVDEVGSHLAMVMIPLLLGGVVGGTVLSALSAPATASAAEMAIPAMPQTIEAIGQGAVVGGSAIAGALTLGAGTTTGALVGTVALAAVIGGSVAVGGLPVAPPAAPTTVAGPTTPSAVVDDDNASPSAGGTPSGGPATGPTSPSNVPSAGDGTSLVDVVDDTVTGVGTVVTDTVDDVVQVVQQPVNVTVSLSGTGTPGATVALKAAGTVYATTTVGANGTFSISAGGIPQTVQGLSLVQTVDQGLLGGLIGGVTNLLKPLVISSNGSGISIGTSTIQL